MVSEHRCPYTMDVNNIMLSIECAIKCWIIASLLPDSRFDAFRFNQIFKFCLVRQVELIFEDESF